MTDKNDAQLRQEILDLQNQIALMAADQERDNALASEAANKLNLVEAMLEIVPVGVVLTDPHGKIVMGNNAVEAMLRHPVLFSPDTKSYGEWVSFHPDGTRVQSHEYPVARVIDEGVDHAEIDVHYQRGDGTRLWVRIIGEPVHDKDGNRIGVGVALIDIDREHQLAGQQEVLIGELNHRVKNAFSVVKSIVSRSLRKEDIPDGVRQTIDDRLDAYASAHAKLVGSDWDHARLTSLVEDIVVRIAGDSLYYEGEDVSLPSRQALALSMALYELATNAVKYGALSQPSGKVDLTWRCVKNDDGGELFVDWKEHGGPEAVSPMEKGFGSFIIDRALAMEARGEVNMHYEQSGFEWHLKMPI